MTAIPPIYRSASFDNPYSSSQFLQPEHISQKIWTDEYETYGERRRLAWEHSILSFQIHYKGSHQHQFKAVILETSLEKTNPSYSLAVQDLNRSDLGNARIYTTLKIDLSDYALFPASFKILILDFSHSALKFGETNLS